MNKASNNNTINDIKYYEILGIDKNATEEEIKDAYLKLAEIWRADKIEEKKGRKPDQTEQQKWHEILNSYSEALKEADNKKGEKEVSDDKQQNKNDINSVNLDDFSENSKESGNKKGETNSFDKGIERFKEEFYYRIQVEINEKLDNEGCGYVWANLKWEKEFLDCFQNCRKKDFGSDGCNCHSEIKSRCDSLNKQSLCAHTGIENGGHNNHIMNHIEFCLSTPEEVESFKKKIVEVAYKIAYRNAEPMSKSARALQIKHMSHRDFETCEVCEDYKKKQGNIEQSSTITDQEETNNIVNNNTQTNQNSAENNAVSSEKKVDKPLSEKEKKISAAKNKQNQKSLVSNNQKTNHLISIGLPIGIFFVLIASSVFWIVKRKGLKKKN